MMELWNLKKIYQRPKKQFIRVESMKKKPFFPYFHVFIIKQKGESHAN